MDDAVKDQLRAARVPPHHVNALAMLPAGVQASINWPALLALVATRGPGLIQDLLAVFGTP